MSWHFIMDDRKLTAHEKLVACAIRRCQPGPRVPVRVTYERISELSALSTRAVKRAIEGAAAKGYRWLRETGARKRVPNLYLIVQEQGLLFSRSNFHSSTGSPQGAQNNRARESLLSDSRVPHSHSLSEKSYEKPKNKSRAEVRPHGPPGPAKPLKSEAQQRRIVSARDKRVAEEAEVRRELVVGAGPAIHPALQQAMRVAAGMHTGGYSPPSDADLERRRQAQKQALEQI